MAAAQMCLLQHNFQPQQFSVQLLVSGIWPQLQHLNSSGINLHPEGVAIPHTGNWPLLKNLIVLQCDVRSSSLKHLTAARWQLLEDLDLSGTALSAAGIIQLSTGIWPHLTHLSLESEDQHKTEDSSGVKQMYQVDNIFKQSIQRAQWPNLTHLSTYGFGRHALSMALLVCCS